MTGSVLAADQTWTGERFESGIRGAISPVASAFR